MSYIEKVKKMFDGKLPKSFSIHMKHMLYEPTEKEEAAKLFFNLITKEGKERQKAKKLGLI